MTMKYQEAKESAPVDSDNGYFEVTLYVWDGDGEIGYLTIDVWADEAELNDISPGLHDELAHSYERDNDRYLSESVHGMLRRGMIWDAECRTFGVHNVEQLKNAFEEGRIEMFPL